MQKKGREISRPRDSYPGPELASFLFGGIASFFFPSLRGTKQSFYVFSVLSLERKYPKFKKNQTPSSLYEIRLTSKFLAFNDSPPCSPRFREAGRRGRSASRRQVIFHKESPQKRTLIIKGVRKLRNKKAVAFLFRNLCLVIIANTVL